MFLNEASTRTPLRGAIFGLLAATLFGTSAPIAKLLLPGFSPLSLAAVLYLGAGIALTMARSIPPFKTSLARGEARLRREDRALLGGIILTGGVAGPVLMLIGLQRLSGMAASLLLNLEGTLTILIAVVVFKEHLGRAETASALLVLLGATLLGYRPGDLHLDVLGGLAIAGACLSWAVDNNLTQRLGSLREPAALVQVKTLGAGALTLAVSLAAGQPFPSAGTVLQAMLLGSLSYGLSIVLDTLALRILGAAREAAFFATAPFVGAIIAIPVLGERPEVYDIGGALLMIAGVAFLLRARHAHVHTHAPLEHDHAHVHDEHHRHPHDGPVTEPHAHPHQHETITHDHPHASDLHHRHPH